MSSFNLLGTANAKTIKGEKIGFLTTVMYLLPHTSSELGVNLCPNAHLAGCEKACLVSAGRGVMAPVHAGRLRKTEMFVNEYERFMNILCDDIRKLKNRANKKGLTPLVRLNGTSDIVWERKAFTLDEKNASKLGKEPGRYNNIMEVFPDVTFYDYTKIAGRFNKNLPANYDLTFSYSGVESYKKQVEHAVKKGARIAVVFRHKEKIPAYYMGMPVVDGDDTDVRHIDPQGVIVALYAKGKAVTDTSGFVVDVEEEVLV